MIIMHQLPCMVASQLNHQIILLLKRPLLNLPFNSLAILFVMKIDSPIRSSLLRIGTWLMTIAGMYTIIAGHGHYTIDVVIAVIIVFFAFNYYHSLVSLRAGPESGDHHRSWFPLFSYFERNVKTIVPNEFECVDFTRLSDFVFRNKQTLKTTQTVWRQMLESPNTLPLQTSSTDTLRNKGSNLHRIVPISAPLGCTVAP